MGVPVVGRRHQREALTPQAADWGCGDISKRICRACGSGRSSINDQQWKQAQKPTANHNQYSLGALFSRGIAAQGFVHARLLQYVRKELDCAPLGKDAVGPDQDSRSRAVAAGNRGRRWNPSQNQVCDVGFVFPCGSLGVLWPQPDLLRHSGRKWRKERAKYGSSCQFQTPKVAVEIDRRTSSAGSDRARVPRSASRVPGCRAGNTSRRTRRTPLDGLRFHQPGLRHPTFLLLASGRAPHRYQVGGFGSAAADAPRAQRWPSGVEIAEPLQPTRRLRLRFGKAQGSQAARSSRRVEKEDPARVQEDWHYRRGLAYVPAHRGNDASGDGRTPTHDPRLLAAQQPPRHEQVPAGDVEDQASSTRHVGRRLLACRLVTQIEPGPIGDAKQRIRNLEFAYCAYRPLISPDPFGSGLVSD